MLYVTVCINRAFTSLVVTIHTDVDVCNQDLEGVGPVSFADEEVYNCLSVSRGKLASDKSP